MEYIYNGICGLNPAIERNPAICDMNDPEGHMLSERAQTKTNTVWPHVCVGHLLSDLQRQRRKWLWGRGECWSKGTDSVLR